MAIESDASLRLRLLFLLIFLTAMLWCLALLDYWRFTSAMSLRFKSCREIRLGHMLEAEAMLEQAFIIDPSQLDIAGDLAELYRRTGPRDRGMDVLDKAVRLARCRPNELALVYSQRGCHLLMVGKSQEASRDLRIALSWEPQNKKLKSLLQLAERRAVWENWTLIQSVPPLSLQR